MAHRVESLLGELAAEHGLTALEARALRALLDGPSQGGLALQLGRAPSGVSVLTRRLEERGLVSRVPSRSDKRVRTARPTEQGMRVIHAIGAGLTERSPLSTRLTDAEIAALYRLLDALDREPPD
ncbi:MarR family winged helix-turn-helix transcriptional regulator [Nocardiopsis potens]|uniref:MarR family winged helix-turn-helix transcriptional regulator n=1 Tax=Nocardiopsis potens TaxID=1246458 RepID=UPI0003744EF8|nr:MarR family transcriptional regulator [Nocardiopsis potens]